MSRTTTLGKGPRKGGRQKRTDAQQLCLDDAERFRAASLVAERAGDYSEAAIMYARSQRLYGLAGDPR